MVHRVASALALAAVVSLHLGAVCEGWESTAEARTACCAPDSDCPMHGDADADTVPVSQAEADTCCRLAERGPINQASLTFAPSIVLALHAAPATAETPLAPVDRGVWRSAAPPPPSAVATHVLLSVFRI